MRASDQTPEILDFGADGLMMIGVRPRPHARPSVLRATG